MRTRVSRRAFLGTAGAATLATTLPTARLAGAQEIAGDAERVAADVAVLGGGVSGAVSARILAAKGLNVVVLRGGERLAAGPGVWATGDHRRVLGSSGYIDAVPDGGDALEATADSARPVPDGKLTADGRAAAELASAIVKLDRMAYEVDLESPWAAVNAPVRDAVTLGSWLGNSISGIAARRRLVGGFELALGAPPSEVSLLFALLVVASAGGARRVLDAAYRPTHELSGGLAAFSDGLTGRVSERSSVARDVVMDGTGAVVSASDCTVEARHLVVPDLRAVGLVAGSDSRRFIEGSSNVVVCEYAGAAWRRSGLSGRVFGDGSPVHAVQPTGSGDTLVAVIAGGAARTWRRLTDEDRREAVVGSLARWLGPEAGEPIAYAEFAGPEGMRVVGPPGSVTAAGPDLRDSTAPISWAGPETATAWIGHVEGLIEAGERAATHAAAALEV